MLGIKDYKHFCLLSSEFHSSPVWENCLHLIHENTEAQKGGVLLSVSVFSAPARLSLTCLGFLARLLP